MKYTVLVSYLTALTEIATETLCPTEAVASVETKEINIHEVHRKSTRIYWLILLHVILSHANSRITNFPYPKFINY